MEKTGSSNEVIKKGFKNDRDSIPLEEQKKYLINLLRKGLLNFGIQKTVNSDNFIYMYKTEEISPEDFTNYQNPIYLFKNLRDGNLNPREVLKNQNDLGEIRKANPKSKSKDNISVIKMKKIFLN